MGNKVDKVSGKGLSTNDTSFLRGDETWQVPTNTTYSTATQSSNGLLSAADKKKLDEIAANAHNYKGIEVITVKFGQTITLTAAVGITNYGNNYSFMISHLILFSLCGNVAQGAPIVLWKLNGAAGTGLTAITGIHVSKVLESP